MSLDVLHCYPRLVKFFPWSAATSLLYNVLKRQWLYDVVPKSPFIIEEGDVPGSILREYTPNLEDRGLFKLVQVGKPWSLSEFDYLNTRFKLRSTAHFQDISTQLTTVILPGRDIDYLTLEYYDEANQTWMSCGHAPGEGTLV